MSLPFQVPVPESSAMETALSLGTIRDCGLREAVWHPAQTNRKHNMTAEKGRLNSIARSFNNLR
jgi:hypothetical protein